MTAVPNHAMLYLFTQLSFTGASLAMQNESEIADALEASDVPREDIFITSKIGPTQVSQLTRPMLLSFKI